MNRVLFSIGLPSEKVEHVVVRATVCVQPSIAEPFGMAVIEAGAMWHFCGRLRRWLARGTDRKRYDGPVLPIVGQSSDRMGA
jgi:hypothetical protein